MSESRKNHDVSLYEQELANRLDAKNQRPVILNMFWSKRIEIRNPHSIEAIKGFIKGRPPNGVERDQWSNIVDAELASIIEASDKQRFINLFQHISDRDILAIDKGEKFGISHQNLPRVDLSKPLSENDKDEINRYMSAKEMSATAVISAQGELSKFATDGNEPDTVFSVHSVGKIFTGVIILELINRGILSEDALAKPLEISESAKKKLPLAILERLKSQTLTLHDVMVHKGGFGDFVGKYVKVIQAAIKENSERPATPEITSIEDFLQYANDDLSDERQKKYSNLAFLLVGLAAEHAHAVYQKLQQDEGPALDFMGMLHAFIQVPSGMVELTPKAPDGAKVNESKVMVAPNEPTPEARYLVGNPSGGYWTSVDDLRKFGEWLYKKCQKEPNFRRLIETYGQEFCSDQLISHQGENPSASAMLSVSLTDGRVIAALSNSGRHDAHDLEEAIRKDLFSRNALDSALKTESGAIDLTKAERIAEGGTHVLYRFPDAPFVLKLMKQNPNKQELDELERKYAVLYDCFDKDGKQRCIREQHITHQVLLPGKEPYEAALSLVPYEKCFKAKTKFDFKMEPAELDPYLVEHHQELYTQANKALINSDEVRNFNLNDYTVIDPRIGAILQRLDNDPKLKDCMIEFLTKYRDFYVKENIILDAMGLENILFFKDQAGDWQFKVGSAIKHDTGNYTNELFTKLHAGKEVVDLNEFVNFTHAYFSAANIRAVNACALKLGLEPIISDVTIDSESLFIVSQRLSVPERMLAYAQHGDFEKMHQIPEENKKVLTFNLGNHWAYSRIADEYIKHGKSMENLKNYLDCISTFKIDLPEKKENATPADEETRKDNIKSIENSKKTIIGWRNSHDSKIKINEDIRATLMQGVRLKAYTGSKPVLMDNQTAKKGPTIDAANGSSTKNIMAMVRAPNSKVVPSKPKSTSSASQANNEAPMINNAVAKAPINAPPQPQATSMKPSTSNDADQSAPPKPSGYSTKLTRDPNKK